MGYIKDNLLLKFKLRPQKVEKSESNVSPIDLCEFAPQTNHLKSNNFLHNLCECTKNDLSSHSQYLLYLKFCDPRFLKVFIILLF